MKISGDFLRGGGRGGGQLSLSGPAYQLGIINSEATATPTFFPTLKRIFVLIKLLCCGTVFALSAPGLSISVGSGSVLAPVPIPVPA